jgi:hypothetical protein
MVWWQLLECGELNCCMLAKDGGGFVRLKGGVALALDLVLKKPGVLLRPMFLIGLDPALRDGGYHESLTPLGERFL